MKCAECGYREKAAEDDYLCDLCRYKAECKAAGHYPEWDKYSEYCKSDGPVLTRFLDWLSASGLTICDYTDRSGYFPEHRSNEHLLREFCDIDSDKLDIEQTAFLEAYREANP